MMRRLSFLLLPVLLLLAPPPTLAGISLQIDKELQLLRQGQMQRHIPYAQFRAAVFSFEDPDGTGLGDALVRILSHDILVRSQVGSIGVLRYVGGLLGASPTDPSYYEKVETLAEAQQVTIAVWGMVRRHGDRIVIDTYCQIPPFTLGKDFSWSFNLPRAMGGGALAAQLSPDRIWVQRYEPPAGEIESLLESAARVSRLRARPRDEERVKAELPMESVYSVEAREGDWVKLNAGTGRTGWVRTTGHCAGACMPLLDAARFVSGLLGFIRFNVPPEVSGTLCPDARAVRDQLVVLNVINSKVMSKAEDALYAIQHEALPHVNRWLEPPAGDAAAVPPGGAAFDNLRALIRIISALRREGMEGSPYDVRRLPREQVATVADELARASLSDPRNGVVLSNLAVLFGYLQDTERAQLARELARSAEQTSRGAPYIPPILRQ